MKKKSFFKNKYTIITFMLLITFSIFFFSYGKDYYWHSKIGEYIINNKQIPFTDVFSWYGISNSLHWISHEWLFEVIISIFNNTFGNYGALIYSLITIVLISYYIFKLNKDIFNNYPFYTIIFSLFGLAAFCSKILPRPHLLSYLFFIFSILIVKEILENEDTKKYLFVPLITVLWANIHGGSSNLGYIIYTIFLVSSFKFLPRHISISLKQKKKLIFCLISSFIFILVNPHFTSMITYPYLNMTYSNMINCIDEWKSLNVISVDGIIYLIFILINLYFIIKNRKKILLIDLILLLPFTILAVKSIKFIPYLYIVSTYIIPKYWSNKKIIVDTKIISIFIICCFILFSITIFKLDKYEKVSDDIINYLKDNDDITLYNSYNLGGYLIYKDIKVFVDGRADLYIDTTLCDVCQIEKKGNFDRLEKYNFDTYVIENKSKLFKYLSDNDNYTLIINDDKNSLFKKKHED